MNKRRDGLVVAVVVRLEEIAARNVEQRHGARLRAHHQMPVACRDERSFSNLFRNR